MLRKGHEGGLGLIVPSLPEPPRAWLEDKDIWRGSKDLWPGCAMGRAQAEPPGLPQERCAPISLGEPQGELPSLAPGVMDAAALQRAKGQNGKRTQGLAPQHRSQNHLCWKGLRRITESDSCSEWSVHSRMEAAWCRGPCPPWWVGTGAQPANLGQQCGCGGTARAADSDWSS